MTRTALLPSRTTLRAVLVALVLMLAVLSVALQTSSAGEPSYPTVQTSSVSTNG